MMRRLNLAALTTLSFASVTLALPASAAVRGDLDNDGTIDVADVQCASLVVLTKASEDPPGCLSKDVLADVDCDGQVTVADVQLTVFMSLEWPLAGLPSKQDADGDNVADACDGPPPGVGENGSSCSVATDCNSDYCHAGFCCADGDCCGVAADCPAGYSCGARCELPGNCQGIRYDAVCTAGQCVRQMVDDDSACDETPNCGAYVGPACTGSSTQPATQLACPSSCVQDSACSAGHTCVGGICVPLVTDGGACTVDVDCASGHCNDGACCQSGDCCTTAADCPLAQGFCVEQSTCDGVRPAAQCVDGRCSFTKTLEKDDRGCKTASVGCGNYKPALCPNLVDAPTPPCPTTCNGDQDCAAGASCLAGKCSLLLLLGGACVADVHCDTGHCADGVCCESACEGPCRYCAHPDFAGKCLTPKHWEDPDEPCPSTSQCAEGVYTAKQRCNGEGQCDWMGGQPCADGFGCASATQCKTDSCTSDSDCGPGYGCNGSVCALATDCSAPANSCSTLENHGCKVAVCSKFGGCALGNAANGTSCNDTDACTTGDTCASGTCAGTAVSAAAKCCHVDSECAQFDDDNQCNGSMRCDQALNKCVLAAATVVTCQTSWAEECNTYVCEEGTGKCIWTHAPEGKPCSSNYAPDSGCASGVCYFPLFGTDISCLTTADCAQHEDNDPCTPTLYCDHSGSSPVCVEDSSTAVSCAAAPNDCQEYVCLPSTGQCALVPSRVGLPCDDSDACTSDDVCTSAGGCDGPDSCECHNDADCAGHSGGDLCKGTYYCDKGGGGSGGTCKVNLVTVVSCTTTKNTDCLENTCNPSTGECVLTATKAGASCSDGDLCTSQDQCNASGACVGTNLGICQCTKTADCAAWEDGNQCNGTLYCDVSSHTCLVNPASIISCPTVTDTACQRNRCQPDTGQCGVEVRTGFCDDGDPCTTVDECSPTGTCIGYQNLCACSTDADCGAFDDGDKCNGSLFCNKVVGKCVMNPASAVTCPSVNDTACRMNLCVPATGTCAMADIDGAVCSDDDGCTTVDRCSDGECVGHVDQCECRKDDDCPLDCDGCTGAPYCDKSAQPFTCKPNPATGVSCIDTNANDCSEPICDPVTTECVPTPIESCD